MTQNEIIKNALALFNSTETDEVKLLKVREHLKHFLNTPNPVSISNEDIAGEEKELVQVYRRAKEAFKNGNMDTGEHFLQQCRDILGTQNDYLNNQ